MFLLNTSLVSAVSCGILQLDERPFHFAMFRVSMDSNRMAAALRRIETVATSSTSSLFGKISSAMNYATAAYIYQPATVYTLEASSAQCLLLSLLHGLVTGDIAFCASLAPLCFGLIQLRSTFLKVWLKDDFSFDQGDVERGLSLLDKLVNDGTLQLPDYVLEALSTMARKYGFSSTASSSEQETGSSLQNQLHAAIANNSARDIIALINKGANINSETDSGDNLVHVATNLGCLESIIALGYVKANFEAKNAEMMTPLQRAVVKDDLPTVWALISAGADITRTVRRGDTMLHLAAASGCNRVMRVLLDGGINVDVKNHSEETPLIQAVKANNDVGVDILMKNGADPVTVPQGFKRPLELAIQSQNQEVINTLIKNGVEVKYCTESGDNPLLIAAHLGNKEIVNTLTRSGANVDTKSNSGKTVLHLATANGNLGLVETIFDLGSAVDLMDNDGNTALSIAVKHNRVSIAKILQAKGANLNVRNMMGFTPLHYAADTGSVEAVAMLLKCGAIVDPINNGGDTPLLIAANERDRVSVAKMLLAEGANPNVRNKRGSMPLHYAVAADAVETVAVLLKGGAIVDAKDYDGQEPAPRAVMEGKLIILQLLVQHGANINSSCKEGNCLLNIAAANGNNEIVTWLLEAGVDLEVKGKYDRTPLICAVESGCAGTVSLLLDRGANPSAKDSYKGDAPLHFAARGWKLDIVKLLCEKGADINIKNSYGQTPLQCNCSTEIIDFLKRKGAL